MEGGEKRSRAFWQSSIKTEQYKNTVFNYQLILADRSDPHHIRELQREMRFSDGTNSGMAENVCFACSLVYLKIWEYGLFACVGNHFVFGCIKMRSTTKEPYQNAMHFSEVGLVLIILLFMEHISSACTV